MQRDLSNHRIQVWIGLASSLGQYDYATEAELAAMVMAAPAIRWNGFDFGMQASEQIDDRSLDDDATATLRGFLQFGGGMPLFFPRATDQSSTLRQIFNLVKTRGTELALVIRAGWVDRKVPGTAGDNISIFKVMSDGFTPDTEGDGGYAYLLNLLPRGDVAPWTIVADSPAAQVVVTKVAGANTPGSIQLFKATYLGNDITQRATWASSDQAAVTINNQGIAELVGDDTDTADITATFPGGVESDPVTVTIAA